MPFALWDCHESFWDYKPFVTWQLLRRNSTYCDQVEQLTKDRHVFVPTRSYPPQKGQRIESWRNDIEFFTELVLQPGKLIALFETLKQAPIEMPNQPDQVLFRSWLDRRELKRKIPYKDLFYGRISQGGGGVAAAC